MTDLEIMQRAKTYIEKMANGLNPITGQPIPDDETLNDVRISRCLFYVSDVLRQVIDNGGEVVKKTAKMQAFTISQEQLQRFELSKEPIPISEITRRINVLVDHENMVNLKYKSITEFLMNAGFLTIVEYHDGSQRKEPTEAGSHLGISVEERMGQQGLYRVVVYNEDAQHFILDNFDGVLEIDRKPASKRENQGKPWTVEHDQQLRELYGKQLSLTEIANTMQRTRDGVKKRLKKLEII
jgi:hypothetical protein